MTADSVRAYLKEIGRTELLTKEEVIEIAKRIEAGVFADERLQRAAAARERLAPGLRRDLQWIVRDGERATTHLLVANLRLVVSLAKRYTGRGMPLLDLIQEGNLGLMVAVKKFDYTKGFTFATYATWWIRQNITRALADSSRIIRLPVHVVEVVNKIKRAERELLRDLGREPTPEEIAQETGLSPEKVVELQAYKDPISLETPVGEDGERTLSDFIYDDSEQDVVELLGNNQLREQLNRVLATLNEREQGVIRLRYGLDDGQPRTLDEIGKVYGVSRERVRQIEREIMRKLRKPDRSEPLRDYWE